MLDMDLDAEVESEGHAENEETDRAYHQQIYAGVDRNVDGQG